MQGGNLQSWIFTETIYKSESSAFYVRLIETKANEQLFRPQFGQTLETADANLIKATDELENKKKDRERKKCIEKIGQRDRGRECLLGRIVSVQWKRPLLEIFLGFSARVNFSRNDSDIIVPIWIFFKVLDIYAKLMLKLFSNSNPEIIIQYVIFLFKFIKMLFITIT